MGQIVKKKKKGRPSKADLARRAGESQAKTQPDLRRSLRRRNVRYNVDYDDYLDECDEDEEEDERRREKKKLKLVVKLNQGKDEDESAPSPTRADARGDHAISASDDDEGERKPLKKRRINGGRYNNEEGGKEEQEEGEENEGDDCNEDEYENKHAQQDSVDAAAAAVKSRKVDSKGLHSASGTPANTSSETPLPNRGLIEYIIAKCQRLDTYSVFAEPVDPEELPDYHDVIKHPMDFATVKSKLLRGQYTTLEQVESDVYLICSNAMTYNSRDTIYHEQAINIRETSHKMFEKLRRQYKRSQGELKSKSNSLVKKQVKKPLGRASQEPVGSDFSSGATLINAGLVQPNSTVMQVGSYELPGNNDSLAEGNNSLIDANQDVAEDLLSGRNLLSKLGRKPSVLEENRRATYNLSNQPVARSESIFSTFESEIKQLVTVGLHAEYAYARSLARFAANLGPVAWKIASHRIQQALPTGCRFGRGWVGEYEPLPTPVLILDHRAQSESNLVAKLRSTDDVIKGHKKCKVLQSALEHPVKGPILEGKQTSTSPAGGPASEGKPSLFGSVGLRPSAPVNVSVFHQQQNVQSRNFGKPENNKGLKQVELNSFPSSNQNDACLGANFSGNAATATSKPREMVPKSMNVLPTAPYKKLDTNGVVRGELPDGKVINAGLDRRVTGPSADGTLNQMGRAVSHVPHGQEQGLSDPVQLMRMLAEKAQKQQASNHSSVDSPPVTQSVPSGRRDDSSNAAAAAARAWMSVGAGGFKQGVDSSGSPKNQISADSLYNPAVEFHQHISRIRGEVPSGGMPFQSEKNNFSFQVLASQPIHTGTASQFPNRPMIFPQLAAADPSRFQMQSPWRGINPHGQPRQKQETLPPDLNIGFQSPGSPARQSSGVLVDSQQPDLALQL